MRFARFKTSVMGHEPQKRNRTADKTRVTKSKKQVKKETLVKSESGVSLSSYAQVGHHSPEIKQEKSKPYLAQFSPASTTSPYMNDGRDDFNTRFLTPCSDDHPHGLSVNPAALEDLRQRNGFGASMDCNPEFLHQPSHDHLGLAHSPAFHTFDAAYDLASYRTPGDAHSPDALEFNGIQSLADCGHEWSDRFQDHHTF